MDFDLPNGYPVIDNTTTSNRCEFSYLRADQQEWTMDFQGSGFSFLDLIEEEFHAYSIKIGDDWEFNENAHPTPKALHTTSEKEVTPQRKDPESIDNNVNSGDGKNITCPDINHNEIGFKNNHKINNDDYKNWKPRKVGVKRRRHFAIRTKLQKMKDGQSSLWKCKLKENLRLRLHKPSR